MRPIDADTLLEKVEKIQPWDAYLSKYAQGIRHCMELVSLLIKDAPTIETERKTGKWIKKMRITETEKYTSYDPDWYCVCCGAKYDPHIARMVNFCYVCGADMRGEQE